MYEYLHMYIYIYIGVKKHTEAFMKELGDIPTYIYIYHIYIYKYSNIYMNNYFCKYI
jgi:hypothetical protein